MGDGRARPARSRRCWRSLAGLAWRAARARPPGRRRRAGGARRPGWCTPAWTGTGSWRPSRSGCSGSPGSRSRARAGERRAPADAAAAAAGRRARLPRAGDLARRRCGARRCGSPTPARAFQRGDCPHDDRRRAGLASARRRARGAVGADRLLRRHASASRSWRSARPRRRSRATRTTGSTTTRSRSCGAPPARTRGRPPRTRCGSTREQPEAQAAVKAFRTDRPAAVGAPRAPPAAVPPVARRPRYPVGSTSRRCGVFLCPAPTHDSRSTPSDGPRRRPDRCDPRLRGVQAPELPDQQVQAQQPGPHQPAQVLPLVPEAHGPPRDPLGSIRRGS